MADSSTARPSRVTTALPKSTRTSPKRYDSPVLARGIAPRSRASTRATSSAIAKGFVR